MPTCATLFSGGGLADVGMRAAGFAPLWAVEHDPAIAAVYAANHGDHILAADVCAIDYTTMPAVNWLHASPVCTRYSVANAQRGESDLDIATAQATVRALEAAGPDYFTVENVQQYEGSDAFRLITRALDRLGYMWHAATLNSADYGVPQTRRRLILRASRGLLRPLPAPVPWVGWYVAIEDLLPTLPASAFAPWQLARLPEEVRESVLAPGGNQWAPVMAHHEPSPTVNGTNRVGNIPRAFIVDGQKAGDPDGARGVTVRHGDTPMFTVTGGSGTTRPARAWLIDGRNVNQERGKLHRTDDEPCITVTTDPRDDEPAKTIAATDAASQRLALLVSSQSIDGESVAVRHANEPAVTTTTNGTGRARAWLSAGRVVAMTPRALARFQSVPDDYALPERKALACKVIGNGVPCLLMQRVGESW